MRLAFSITSRRDMQSEDWELAHTEEGIQTFLRRDEGDNTLAWRTHGEIEDCPVISQVGGIRRRSARR